MRLRTASAIFLIALSTSTFASHTSSEPATASGKFYIGAFGGYGSSNNFNSNQLGTVYFLESFGGSLGVNAFGTLSSESASFWGAQLGYQTSSILFTPSSHLTLTPAAELEAYTMGDSTFNGTLTNVNTTRLSEHAFAVSYPMSRNIFLANAVLNFNYSRFPVHPYVGLGIGSAIVRISDASATTIDPAEVGVNHYNTNSNDTNSVFAGQIKLGVSYDINKYVSLFADYRWLYIGSTDFVFGSTVYPDHAETSSWQVNLDAQRYNLGDVGVRLNLG